MRGQYFAPICARGAAICGTRMNVAASRSSGPAPRLTPALCKKGENLQELYIAATSIRGLDGPLSPKRIDFHCEEFEGRHLFTDSRVSVWRYPCAGMGLRASRKDA